MARQSTDDKFLRDPRVDKLALFCGWSRRETRSCLQDVWALCYDRVVPYLPADDIEVTALRDAISPPKHEKGFVGALLQSELGRPAVASDRYYTQPKGEQLKIPFADLRWQEKIYLAGARDHIGYLLNQKANGKKGGAKSAEVRQNSGKGRLTDPTASLDRASSQAPSSLSLALPLVPDLPLALEQKREKRVPRTALRAVPDPEVEKAFTSYETYFTRRTGRPPTLAPSARKRFDALAVKLGPPELERRIGILASTNPWPNEPWTVAMLEQHIDRIAAPASNANTQVRRIAPSHGGEEMYDRKEGA